MKGLENAIRNLNSLDTRMVPQASAWAINRVAQKAVSVATRQVAGNTVAGDNQVKGIPLKLVRQRVRVFKASPSGKMTARIRVNRGNLPAIKLGTARVRLARRGGKLQYRGSVLKVGKYLFRDAFIQQLANGRWHVMRRIDGKNRYPIDVVKVPLSGPLTQAFEDARDRIIAAEMPKQPGVCTETTTEVMADPMNRHTQIRQAVLARLREQCGDSATFFDGLPAFIDAQELPAVAVWLSDAQYTGKMTDEDDWQAVLHIAVFIRAQAPDSELDMWMESTIFPALNDIPALSGLIDTLIPLGFNYQRDNEMATWAMAEITYQITYTN